MEVDDRSMDMMMMMMMPEFPENFPDPQFSMPINNIPPTYINNINPPPIISSPSSSNFLNTNHPIHQGMRARNNNNNCSMGAMREMIFRIAVMQPIQIDPEAIKAPKRRNVKISKDPQSVAARHRRERISERIRILQRLVPGGTKMDTASMLDEAIHYVKFLKKQVQTLHQAGANRALGFGLPTTAAAATTNVNYYSCSSIKDAGNYNYHHHPSSNMMV